MKTWTAGEELKASDLNANFDEADNRLTAIEGGALAVTTAGSNTITLNFDLDRLYTRAADGNVTFAGANYTAAKSVTVRVTADGTARDLSFPADWKFVSIKPTSLAANKTGVLATTCFGTAASDVVAAWAFED